MPYTSPATVVTATTITSAWGNSVKAAVEFLANPPACRVYNSAALPVADNAMTAVTFNTERYDTDTMHSTSSLTSRITFTTAGLYLLTFNAELAAAADYVAIYCDFYLGGATVIATNRVQGTALSDVRNYALTTVYKFTAGQYVEARVYQDNTASASRNLLAAANASPELSATWVGLG